SGCPAETTGRVAVDAAGFFVALVAVVALVAFTGFGVVVLFRRAAVVPVSLGCRPSFAVFPGPLLDVDVDVEGAENSAGVSTVVVVVAGAPSAFDSNSLAQLS